MTEGERVKSVRKAKGLTLEKFGESFGMSRSSISDIENGRRSLTPQTRLSICREFNVNREWLETGEGEMFVKKEPQPLDKLLSELLGGEAVTNEDKVLMKNFLELSDDSRKAVIEFVKKCAAELATPPPEPPLPPASDPDIAAKLAKLEKQNREIMAQNQALAAEIAAIREEDAEQERAEATPESVSQSQSR